LTTLTLFPPISAIKPEWHYYNNKFSFLLPPLFYYYNYNLTPSTYIYPKLGF
jgi:hypothetical protein